MKLHYAFSELAGHSVNHLLLAHTAIVVVTLALPSVHLIAADAPGAPVTAAFPLAQVRQQARAYADALQVPGKPYGCYKNHADKEPSLYASCDVAILRVVMGEDLKESLSAAQLQEWINHLNSFARPDGRYGPPLRGHTFEHANGMVVGALGALGGRQLHPVRLYDAFDMPAEVGPWLDQIDWRNQWGGSHLFWGGMHCFSFSRRCTDAWREAVFAWLDANLDPSTGWWRKGVPHARPHEPLGGAAHIWPVYQHHGRRFPYPERVIDSILALQKPDGSWLAYGNYMDLDALYGLAYMRSLAPGYRAKDVTTAVQKHGRGLVERWPAFLERKPDLHVLLGAVGAFGLLNQLLPETYPDQVKWTDIFSDLRLYNTRNVEIPDPSQPAPTKE